MSFFLTQPCWLLSFTNVLNEVELVKLTFVSKKFAIYMTPNIDEGYEEYPQAGENTAITSLSPSPTY